MKNKPLVSVIVPVYNVENYLDRCMNSILNQTYQNYEVLLIDDGSTDQSAMICDEYMKYNNKVVAYHKTNGGLSDARNFGIEKSKGDYLCFIDSDDYIDERYLEKLLDILLKNNADIAAIDFQIVYDNTNRMKYETDEVIVYDRQHAIEALFENDKYQDYAWNKLYKRDLFVDLGYPVGYYMEDVGTTYKLILKCDCVVFNPSKLYYYFQRANSIANKSSKKLYQDKYVLSMRRYEEVDEIFHNLFQNDLYIANKILELFSFIPEAEVEHGLSVLKKVWKTVKCNMPLKRRIRHFMVIYLPVAYKHIFGKV